MGKPAPIYDIDLLDEDGNSCEDGIVGSICIKNTDKKHPTGLFREYWKAPDAMARSWKTAFTTRAIPLGAMRTAIIGSSAAMTT